MLVLYESFVPILAWVHLSVTSDATFSRRTVFLIHAISRHGDRAPVDTYPTDPHINETFAPYGWGQLSKVGMINQYKLGRFLWKKYNQFLGDFYSPEYVSVQSTDSDRTRMSAQLQMAGLFPPKKDQICNKSLMWQPVSVNYEQLNDDKLLLFRIPCPRYYELQNQMQKLQTNENDSFLYRYLSQNTRMNVATPNDVQSLYSTLKAEEEFGLKLPRWTSAVYPSRMYQIAAKSFELNAYTQEMQKLRSGYLLNKILDNFHRKINLLDYRKMFIYVGHDSTIANLLIALGIWDVQVPDYNTLITIELHKIKDFAVKVFAENTEDPRVTFKNNTGVYDLKLPNCKVYCPIQKFVNLTKNVTLKKLERECFDTTWRLKIRDVGSP